MPKDKHGKTLAVGDTVTVECTVESVTDTEDAANVALVTVEPAFPASTPTTIVLSGKQVERVEQAVKLGNIGKKELD